MSGIENGEFLHKIAPKKSELAVTGQQVGIQVYVNFPHL